MARRVSSSGSIKKAILLILAFFFILFLYLVIPKLGRMLKEQASQPNYSRGEFGAEVQDSIRREWAGFWVFEDTSDSNKESGVTKEVDRIEFKENGIIWRVKDYTIFIEDYDTVDIRHIYQGYCRPFKKMNGRINCETRIVKQVIIMDDDTCYANQEDVVWIAEMSGSGLFVNGKQFSEYQKEDLTEFFPEGSLDLVDNINIEMCYMGLGLEYILIRELKSYFSKDVLIAEDIVNSINSYYFPLVLKEKFYQFEWGSKDSCVIEMNFNVNDKGKVQDCLIEVNIDNFSNWKENSICGLIEKLEFHEDAAGRGKKFELEFVLEPR